MLSKENYQAIAKIIKGNKLDKSGDYESGYNNCCYYIALDLADYFIRDNPRFDCARFLNACGIE